MKKALTLIAAALLSVAVLLSACGQGADSSSSEQPSSSSEAVSSPSSSEPASSTSSSEDAAPEDASSTESTDANATLQEIVDQSQSMISSMESALGDAMSIEILAEGNVLVYKYTYKTDIPDKEAAKTALEEGMAAQSTTFEGIASTLRDQGVEDSSVKIQYLSMDGEVIYETEFK